MINPKIIFNHDNENSTTGASPMSLNEFQEYTWELQEVPLDMIAVGDWNPSKPLGKEGYIQDEPFDEGRFMEILSSDEDELISEDHKYREQWEDEVYAREYAKLTTPSPAIIMLKVGDKYKLRSGRHRSRSEFLKGSAVILAYVGTKI